MHRIALLSAVGVLALAGEANGAPVQCPSVSVKRVPVHAHHAVRPASGVRLVKHRHIAKKRKSGTVVAKRAAAPNPGIPASNNLPVLAPILPPDTLPATTPVLAPGVQPATPIIGYRLKRSVKMVACEPVNLVTASNLVTPPGGPAAEASYIPTVFKPPQTPLLQTLPPGPPGSPPTTPPGCCNTPPYTPPTTPPPGAVPEPATWAMLIVGFFGLGAQIRRSTRRTRTAGAASV